MTRFRMRAALAAATTAALAAGVTLTFSHSSASAAPAEDPNPVTALLAPLMPAAPADPNENSPGAGNSSPGTGGDAYKEDDPFVDHGNGPENIPANTIIAQSFKFFPDKMTVAPGQEITFDNQDVAIHNVQTDGKKPVIKSPDAEGGQKVTFKAPAKAGKYEAFCYYHQSMIIDITVK